MNLESTQNNPRLPERLFDPSEEWLRVAEQEEPDFSVDGLRSRSVIERLLGLFGRDRSVS